MVFNSLGSNYDFLFVLRSLFSVGTEKDKIELERYLVKRYGGEVVLLYKNREAIKFALLLLNLPKNSKVGICGFTCQVVDQAVKEANLTPIYLKIDKSLNFKTSTLEEVNNLKVVIIQNTLGNPCDMGGISKFCKEEGIILIEDLAHSVGACYKDGKEVGTVGDFTVLSFSQDKIIDAVSGGALIIRDKRYQNIVKVNDNKFSEISLKTKLKDRFYPLFTYLIRLLYPIGLGRVLHYILKKFSLLSKPIENNSNIKFHELSNWYAKLINNSFNKQNHTLKHRRYISSIYANNLDKTVISKECISNIELSSCLRFPILVQRRKDLIKYLNENDVYVSDIWYDKPVSELKYSKEIINLPTHINISISEALRVSKLINKWINTR